MKFFIKAVLSLTMFVSVSLWASIQVGDNAPSFELMDGTGTLQNLDSYKGKKVILEWTNHSCPFVKKHYGSGNMQALQKKYTDEGVIWLSIISSAPGNQGHVNGEEATSLSESRNASPTHVLLDPTGEVGRTYGAKTTPHIFIIDEHGVLQYKGAIDSVASANPADIEKADNYIDLAMASLNKGEKIATSLSRPYGCSVKYGK